MSNKLKLPLIFLCLAPLWALANFVTSEDIANCQTGSSYQAFINQDICETKTGKECFKLEQEAICQTLDLEDELVNGEPILTKENVTSCDSQEECSALGTSLCENPDNFVWKENLLIGFGEAYCTRITGYEQVKTGRKVLKENVSKKAAWLANLEAKRLEQEAKRIEEEEVQAEIRAMAKERIKARKK